jgi:YidC/Oxa1 family membrane protein insertase
MFDTLIVTPLLNLVLFFYAVLPFHDLGVAIIIVTILVRLLVWPLASKQLHSQRAMQKLAPEIAKLRKKAGGDKTKESQMLMELYKEKGISPFASLTPVLIQMPLLIAFYFALRHAVVAGDLAKVIYEPIANMPAIKDILANPASYKPMLFGIVDLAKPNIIIAALAGIAQFFQTKQIMPKKPADKADTAAQVAQISVILFPFMTFLFAMSLPSALGLYWFVASLVTIIQQHLILRKDVEEMEEIGDKKEGKKAGRKEEKK